MKSLFEVLFKKTHLQEANTESEYATLASLSATDLECEFETTAVPNDTQQDEMQIDNIYRCL